MKKMNLFKFTNKLPNSWYTGKTNLPILNNLISKVNKYAYLHHIERLMIAGNIALLYNINPKEVYKWFMTCFIDSYEWVMIPNIFGMSQHSLENISMMGRIYISSSNYLKKMSDYKKDDGFDEIDKLYWNFIKKHKNIIKHDYMLASQIRFIKN